jgi:hypothetical protein
MLTTNEIFPFLPDFNENYSLFTCVSTLQNKDSFEKMDHMLP